MAEAETGLQLQAQGPRDASNHQKLQEARKLQGDCGLADASTLDLRPPGRGGDQFLLRLPPTHRLGCFVIAAQEAHTEGLCLVSPLVLCSAVLLDIETSREEERGAESLHCVLPPGLLGSLRLLQKGGAEFQENGVPCQLSPSPCRREHRPARNCLQNIRQKTCSPSNSSLQGCKCQGGGTASTRSSAGSWAFQCGPLFQDHTQLPKQ